MVEFSSITAAIAIGVGLWNLIRVEQVRRAGTDEGLRQKLAEEVAALHKRIEVEGSILREKLEIEHLKTSILEARLKPLLDSFDKRLAEMFHQPAPEAQYTDHLIERYQVDPNSLTNQELDELIDFVAHWAERKIHQTPAREGVETIAADIFLAILNGHRAVRQLHEVRGRS